MSTSGDEESDGQGRGRGRGQVDEGLRIVTRNEWRAQLPVKGQAQRVSGRVTHVFAFNTFTKPCLRPNQCMEHIRATQKMQMRREFLYDIRYNFMIGADGEVYEGRGWGVVPGLPLKWGAFKNTSLMIGIIGTYLQRCAMRIVSRQEWSAENSLFERTMKEPARYVFCMNTHTDPCYTDSICRSTCIRIQRYQINVRGFRDIRYSFLIGTAGNIFEGRGWFVTPMLPIAYSKLESRAVVFGMIGTYTEETLPKMMMEARQSLIEHGIANNFISKDFKPVSLLACNSSAEPSAQQAS